jgi:hypothetical protein
MSSSNGDTGIYPCLRMTRQPYKAFQSDPSYSCVLTSALPEDLSWEGPQTPPGDLQRLSVTGCEILSKAASKVKMQSP